MPIKAFRNHLVNLKNKQNLDYLFPTFAQFGTSVGSLTRTYKI
ncbi:hypothetical protein EW15_1585 [Prochlorococcus sp. MIT 0801]|nr:hypothetical protein EW15_1585 [Prochlorococcus sp. MIT 0801]